MTKPGPKPMTKSQLIARGSPLADTREDHVEQLPDYIAPVCPKWLDRVGKKEFRRVLAILEKQRHVTEADGTVLGLYCAEFSDLLKARAECEALASSDVTSAGGQCYQHPAVTRKNACTQRLHKLAGDLFMSPASRKSLRLPPVEISVAAVATAASTVVVKDDKYWEELSRSKDRFFGRRSEWEQHLQETGSILKKDTDGEWRWFLKKDGSLDPDQEHLTNVRA
jgi:P27 family predicted phage terminase small subunit